MALAFSCKGGGNGEEPVPSAIDSITITDPSSGTLRIVQGESSRIRYSTVPEVTTAELEWAVDDEGIASVKNGRVTGIAPGTTVVTVSSGEVFAKVDVIVKPIPVESFTLPMSVNAYVDCLAKVSVSVEPAEANAASLTWETDDKDAVEIVMKGGEVWLKALAADKDFVIRASAEGLEAKTISGKTYAARMTIGGTAKGKWYSPYEDGKVLEFGGISGSSGSSRTIYMCLYPYDSVPDPDKTSATSSDESVVKVSVGEVSTGSVANGTLRIYLEEGTDNGSSDVTVTYDDDLTGQILIRSITVTKSPVAFGAETDIYKSASDKVSSTEEMRRNASLKVHMFDKASGAAPAAKWSSSDTSIVTVTAVNPNAGGASHEAEVKSASKFGTAVITAADETGSTRSFTVDVKAVKMPAGTDMGLVSEDGTVSRISSASGVSIRSTKDGRHSVKLCLIDGSGKKLTFGKASWGVSGAGLKISQATGDETTLTVDYTEAGGLASVKVEDDVDYVSKTVRILPARGFGSRRIKGISGSEVFTGMAKIDFGRDGRVGLFNGDVLQIEDIGLTWSYGSALTSLFTITEQDGGVLKLVSKGVKGKAPVIVTSEQGETATIQVASAESHFKDGTKIYYTVPPFQPQDRNPIDALYSKGFDGAVVTETIYLQAMDSSLDGDPSACSGVSWTVSNSKAAQYSDENRTYMNTLDAGCVTWFNDLADRKCTVTATDGYGSALSFKAEVRQRCSLSSGYNLYYRVSENGGKWSGWKKETGLGKDFQVQCKSEPRKLQYKIAASSSADPAVVAATKIRYKGVNPHYNIKESHGSDCNFQISLEARVKKYYGTTLVKDPEGFPDAEMTFYDDYGNGFSSAIDLVDKNN